MHITNFKYIRNYKRTLILVLILILISLVSGYNTKQTLSAGTPPYLVKVTGIRFVGGIGLGPTSSSPYTFSTYYRGYGFSGTEIELTAEMSLDGGTTYGSPMYGDVQFTVTYTDSTNTGTFTVTIPSGSYTATGAVPYDNSSGFLTGWIASPSTVQWTYNVTAAGGDYVSSLASSASNSVYWNRDNPPTTGNAVISLEGKSVTQTSLTLYWDPVDTSTVVAQDFYEYRIYYKANTDSSYKLWNGTNDSTLRGLTNNPGPPYPVSDASKHFDSNSWKYTSIPNLEILTAYSFYITAVDVFGNEVSYTNAWPPAGSLRNVTTLPYSLSVTISDGITSYSDFTNLTNNALRPLRETNTVVSIYTVASTQQPDACYVWFAPVSTEPLNMLTALLVPNTSGLGANLDSVAAVNTGTNKWTAYLPTVPSTGKNQIIKNGAAVRFIVELRNNGVSTFVDRDSDTDPNLAEWTYLVGTPSIIAQKPTYILNNVITDDNTRAYPCYYLTEDAYVTLSVIDEGGNTVSVLLDNAFRRSGENIKENGWKGNNKSGNILGNGIYYIHFYAKGYSSGSTILLDNQKVLIAR